MGSERQPTAVTEIEELLETGDQAWTGYEVEDALRAWEHALELTDQISETNASSRAFLRCQLYSRMARIWLARGATAQAVEAVDNFGHQAGMGASAHPELPVLAHLWQERVARQQRDLDQAQRLIQETLRMAERLPPGETKRRTLAKAHLEQGIVAIKLSENHVAMNHLSQARALYQQLGDRAGEAECVMNVGRLYRLMNLIEQSLAHYREAEAIFQTVPHDPPVEYIHQLGLGSILSRAEKYVEARRHYQIALDLARRLGSDPYVASCLNNVAVILQRQGEAEKALELYQEALEHLRRRQDEFGIATVLSNIGEVHLDLNNTGEALLMLKKSIRAAEDANYRHILPTTYCLLSIAYLLIDRPAAAFDFAEKALRLAEEIGNMPYAGMAYRTLGITAAALERQGHLPSIVPSGGPEAYFTTSMEILSGLNFSYEQARTLLAWGTYLRQSHDPTRRAKGESYLERAAAQFEQLELPLPWPSSLGQTT